MKKKYVREVPDTPKTDECQIKIAQSFSESLANVEVVSNIKELTANILGVTNVSKSLSCCSRGKKVIVKGRVAQKTSSCKSNWYLRVYAESIGRLQEKLCLSVFNNTIHKFQDLCNFKFQGLLMFSTVKFSYDTQSYRIIDVDVINF